MLSLDTILESVEYHKNEYDKAKQLLFRNIQKKLDKKDQLSENDSFEITENGEVKGTKAYFHKRALEQESKNLLGYVRCTENYIKNINQILDKHILTYIEHIEKENATIEALKAELRLTQLKMSFWRNMNKNYSEEQKLDIEKYIKI